MVFDKKCSDRQKRSRGKVAEQGMDMNGGNGRNGANRGQDIKRAEKRNSKNMILKSGEGRQETKIDKEIAAWQDWLKKTYPTTGYDWYMITLMFNDLSGRRDAKLLQMEHEADLIYTKMITRIYREPFKELNLPLFILHPDLPVPKNSKISLKSVTINDGWHLSGICIIPKKSRLNGKSLDEHVAANSNVYKSHSGRIRRIHISKIDRTPVKAVDYCFKALKRGWIESGNTFIWPKAKSELSRTKCSDRPVSSHAPKSAT